MQTWCCRLLPASFPSCAGTVPNGGDAKAWAGCLGLPYCAYLLVPELVPDPVPVVPVAPLVPEAGGVVPEPAAELPAAPLPPAVPPVSAARLHPPRTRIRAVAASIARELLVEIFIVYPFRCR